MGAYFCIRRLPRPDYVRLMQLCSKLGANRREVICVSIFALHALDLEQARVYLDDFRSSPRLEENYHDLSLSELPDPPPPDK